MHVYTNEGRNSKNKAACENPRSTQETLWKRHLLPCETRCYLGWEDAFDVEFEHGLCFLEPHATIRKANRISARATPVQVEVDEELHSHFKVTCDTGEIAEISWAFIRELPPKPKRK